MNDKTSFKQTKETLAAFASRYTIVDDKSLLECLLLLSQWEIDRREIENLPQQAVVSRARLDTLRGAILQVSLAAALLEVIQTRIVREFLDAEDALEKLEKNAQGYILTENHPALKE